MSINLADYLKDDKLKPVEPKDLKVGEFYVIKYKDNNNVRPSLVDIGKLINNAQQQPLVRNPAHDRFPHVDKYFPTVTEPYFVIYSIAHKRNPVEIHADNRYRVEKDYRDSVHYEFYEPPVKIKETTATDPKDKDTISNNPFTILEPLEKTDSNEKAGGKKRKTKKGKRGKKSKDSRKKSKSKRKNRK